MTQNYNNNLTLLKGETTMNVFHLSKKQIKILKGMYLSEMQPDISWGDTVVTELSTVKFLVIYE